MRHEELTVDGQAIQTLYNWFVKQRFRVNRRYQRKLVWSIDEKRQLIDSIVHGLPIPLVLLAASPTSDRVEVIDGLQRLHAIFGFIENEFPIDDGYFNLEALADTKDRSDRGELQQAQGPCLDRDVCLNIANYKVPVSVFSAADEGEVEEVFRRINANGRQLSSQEIRHAGSLGAVADVVRKSAAAVRGDDLTDDIVSLRDIARVSLSGVGFGDHGIDIDKVFWVRHGILGRDQVRASKDEELVLDVIADLLLPQMGPSGTRYRDGYYQHQAASSIDAADEAGEAETAASRLADEVERRGVDDVRRLIEESIDLIDAGLREARIGLRSHIGGPRRNPIPRYFHAILVAVASRLRDGYVVDDATRLVGALENVGASLSNVMGGGGGDWNAAEKAKCIRRVTDAISPVFREMQVNEAVPLFNRDSYVRRLLRSANSEESAVELKLGFTDLTSERGVPGAGLMKRLVKHATAIANRGPQEGNGYIIVGIADSESDARSAEEFLGVTSVEESGFYVVGTEHDTAVCPDGIDDFRRRVRTAMTCDEVSSAFIDSLLKRLTTVRVQGRLVWVFEIPGSREPVSFGDAFYQRVGASTEKVQTDDLRGFMQLFPAT